VTFEPHTSFGVAQPSGERRTRAGAWHGDPLDVKPVEGRTGRSSLVGVLALAGMSAGFLAVLCAVCLAIQGPTL
jgi:hypothetical protein